MTSPQEQAPYRVIPLDEFLEFGQFIHNALDRRQLEGADEYGVRVRFGLAKEMGEVSTDPLVTPPYGNVMDLKTFVQGIGVGIAMHRKQELSPTFNLEVNVAVPAILLPRAELSARSTMDVAIDILGRVRRQEIPYIDARLPVASASAIGAESTLREIRFNLGYQYANYASAAEYFQRKGTFEGYADDDGPDDVDDMGQDVQLMSGGLE